MRNLVRTIKYLRLQKFLCCPSGLLSMFYSFTPPLHVLPQRMWSARSLMWRRSQREYGGFFCKVVSCTKHAASKPVYHMSSIGWRGAWCCTGHYHIWRSACAFLCVVCVPHQSTPSWGTWNRHSICAYAGLNLRECEFVFLGKDTVE